MPGFSFHCILCDGNYITGEAANVRELKFEHLMDKHTAGEMEKFLKAEEVIESEYY